ncbi:MAG: tyrosine-type recombinase/integrase, partial [Myxococcota bacterium]
MGDGEFADWLSVKIHDYINLRRSLGHAFDLQASTLRAFGQFVSERAHPGPITGELAAAFVLGCDVTPNVRARRHAMVRRFSEYLAIFDARTERLDERAFPRSRAIPPARILDDGELARLLAAARTTTRKTPSLREETLYTLVGLLASTGLRSGEALRLDRAHVDLASGVLQILRTKFRKDRLVPLHPSTVAQLRAYAAARDRAFSGDGSTAFFVSLRGGRLSCTAFREAFHQARARAGLDGGIPRPLRPHDLRHRFAVLRLVTWYTTGRSRRAHDVTAVAHPGRAQVCGQPAPRLAD